jgi:EEF1A lysine methyltransferase 4
MDVRDMTFDDKTFDIAIDKGKPFVFQTVVGLTMHVRIGTMDAMMTAKGDVWVRFTIRNIMHESLIICQQDPPQQVLDDCTREVDEVLRFGRHHLICKSRHLISRV